MDPPAAGKGPSGVVHPGRMPTASESGPEDDDEDGLDWDAEIAREEAAGLAAAAYAG